MIIIMDEQMLWNSLPKWARRSREARHIPSCVPTRLREAALSLHEDSYVRSFPSPVVSWVGPSLACRYAALLRALAQHLFVGFSTI